MLHRYVSRREREGKRKNEYEKKKLKNTGELPISLKTATMLWRACDSLHSNDMFAQTCYASHILYFFADIVVVANAIATYMHSLLANVCCRC